MFLLRVVWNTLAYAQFCFTPNPREKPGSGDYPEHLGRVLVWKKTIHPSPHVINFLFLLT
jgi:hypothetical protein